MLIKTIKPARWSVAAPPSKSYTNRALLIAALAKGKSILLNPLFCDDSGYMIKALNEFGVKTRISKERIVVEGKGGFLKPPKRRIYVGNAGTTFRFLTTASALCNGEVILDGNKRMRERPIADLLQTLEELGALIDSKNGYAPLRIFGGYFPGGKTSIKGTKSSQYISSILLSAPYAMNDIQISIDGILTSKPYVDITLNIMKDFGVTVKNNNYRKFSIISGKKYKCRVYQVEGDASNASYFFAAAAVTGGEIEVFNLPLKSVQGDLRFIDILKKMGCKVNRKTNSIIVKGGNLKGITVDMNSMPDVVPTLAVVACFAEGITKIFNVENLRIKESDRIKSLCKEISKIGINVRENRDGLTIIPGEMHGSSIETYDDHRIAMCFSIAGLKIKGINIENPQCVKKSFPDFWKVFKDTFYKN